MPPITGGSALYIKSEAIITVTPERLKVKYDNKYRNAD